MARISIIADDNDVAALISDVLSDEGHTVAVCVRPVDGLAWTAAHPADLILVDMWMETPTQGLDLVSSLRRCPEMCRVPLVLCSDGASIGDARGLTGVPGLPVLQKPFTLDELEQVVDLALDGGGQWRRPRVSGQQASGMAPVSPAHL